MSPRFRQCARLARVRTIQHGLAAATAERAVRQVETLESSAGKLASLRIGFGTSEGMSSGATLASLGEIAMRLDLARAGLSTSIAGARHRAAACREARLVARRDQESAERLTRKAATEAARRNEKKQAQRPLARRRDDEEYPE